MDHTKIRNIAIIAHVDHGKTTLVDQLFRQSGLFRENQAVDERLMDSMDLERERGITIQSKNGACEYQGYTINIIDTPGHADFGGEVERVLKMADGALFLVDAAEGPMPQSYFVLKKAVALDLPVIVVVNKIDKPAARCDWVVDQVFDLLVTLNAPDHILDFPVLYASAKDGHASLDYSSPGDTVFPVFDVILDRVSHSEGDPDGPLQLLVSTISYSSFLGRLGIGKITSGSLKMNQDVVVSDGDDFHKGRITKIYRFSSNQQVESDAACLGDIVAVAGIDDLRVGRTITDPVNPIPLPEHDVDPPTISVNMLPNDSPFSGQEGTFVTGNQLWERLEREVLSDVALQVKSLDGVGFKVSGRGELHLSILIEKMRREGYEFQISPPTVILKEENGKKQEPYEEVTITAQQDLMGSVIESLGQRKGEMVNMIQEDDCTKVVYRMPTRGLLGYLSECMTQTKGRGQMTSRFVEYGPFVGDIRTRSNGVMIANQSCETVAFALFNLQERGDLFLGPGIRIYEGQIVGEHAREDDLVVNPAKGKKLTNMRSSGSDDAVILTPHRQMSLEECMAYIEPGELLEITPKAIRLRKVYLKESDRKLHKQL